MRCLGVKCRMLLTTRPEPLRSSGCNIQMALTSFGNGESWDGCGSLFLLLSVPLPCRAASLFPTLDGAWMTGSELPPGPREPRSAHPGALPAPAPPLPAPAPLDLRARRARSFPSSACRSDSADK